MENNSPIRIFIGASPNGDDAEAQAVLEYTLRKNTKSELDITWMILTNDRRSPYGGWNTFQFSTPFTPFRWTIPEVCNHQGKAIYMDCDTICMADIAELWDQDMDGKAILVQNKDGKLPIRTCVSLWDCEKARQLRLPEISILKRNRDPHLHCNWILTYKKDELVVNFKGKWNCVDLKESSLDDSELKIIHCSSIAHQPHRRHTLKRNKENWYDGYSFPHWREELTELFDKLFIEAQEAGYNIQKYIPKEEVNYKIRTYKNARVKGYG